MVHEDELLLEPEDIQIRKRRDSPSCRPLPSRLKEAALADHT